MSLNYSNNVISRLDLTNFRNYNEFSLDLAGQSLAIIGKNGSGKTNLLEALSLFSPGRGLRRANYINMVSSNNDSSYFSLYAALKGGEGDISVGTDFSINKLVRRLKINSDFYPLEYLSNYLRLSWLTPTMDSLFINGASEGRRFLDRLILSLDPMHAKRLSDYERLMKSRNKLLINFRQQELWLDTIELQLSEIGVAIAAARLDLVQQLMNWFDKLEVDYFSIVDVKVKGYIEDQLLSLTAQEVEDNFKAKLKELRHNDSFAGRTTVGIHRSEFMVEHRKKKIPANLCSTGEQKMLLVGIILCHARLTKDLTGFCPILLLDEVSSHLDIYHREQLFESLVYLGGQFFLTGTDKNLFASLEHKINFLSTDAR